ncbi:MAG TPA: hypothetical protein VIK96_00075 [Bacilli bacterium]
MERNKYNAKFYDENKKLNPEEKDNPENRFSPPLTETSDDSRNVEFGKENCQEEFERIRRERNKQKNLT